jgi:hypothetical protein
MANNITSENHFKIRLSYLDLELLLFVIKFNSVSWRDPVPLSEEHTSIKLRNIEKV